MDATYIMNNSFTMELKVQMIFNSTWHNTFERMTTIRRLASTRKICDKFSLAFCCLYLMDMSNRESDFFLLGTFCYIHVLFCAQLRF